MPTMNGLSWSRSDAGIGPSTVDDGSRCSFQRLLKLRLPQTWSLGVGKSVPSRPETNNRLHNSYCQALINGAEAPTPTNMSKSRIDFQRGLCNFLCINKPKPMPISRTDQTCAAQNRCPGSGANIRAHSFLLCSSMSSCTSGETSISDNPSIWLHFPGSLFPKRKLLYA